MSTDDQEERRLLSDIQNQIQRAKRLPAGLPAAKIQVQHQVILPLQTTDILRQRRETLNRLIESVHSQYSSLKSFAANNIKWFITDFPDLEDDAINAVYDLCEDPDAKVRSLDALCTPIVLTILI